MLRVNDSKIYTVSSEYMNMSKENQVKLKKAKMNINYKIIENSEQVL